MNRNLYLSKGLHGGPRIHFIAGRGIISLLTSYKAEYIEEIYEDDWSARIIKNRYGETGYIKKATISKEEVMIRDML